MDTGRLVILAILATVGLGRSAPVTVASCDDLATALTGTADLVVIDAGKTIDVSTCSSGRGLPVVARPLSLQGGGLPLPVLTGKKTAPILSFGAASDGSSYNFTIRNLVFTNGDVPPNSGSGGCIVARAGVSGVLFNVTFSRCVASSGGAIFLGSGSGVTANNCTFVNNYGIGSSYPCGGAVGTTDQSNQVSISGCLFANNAVIGLGSSQDMWAQGGAVCSRGKAYISTSVFTNNSVTNTLGWAYAGALSADTLVITGSTFRSNWARGFRAIGGVVHAGDVVVASSSFTSNWAESMGGPSYPRPYAGGGAIHAWRSLNTSLSFFTNNSALSATSAAYGGAIWPNGADWTPVLVFYKTTFYGNAARGLLWSHGGAIDSGFPMNFTDCVFQQNSAASVARPPFSGAGEAVGGAVWAWNGRPVFFSGCSFLGNTATGLNFVAGGAVGSVSPVTDSRSVYLNNSATLLSSSCGSGQSCPPAAYGGAMWLSDYALQVTSSTFTSNSVKSFPSDGAGGAIALQGSAAAVITGSTFSLNSATSGCTLTCSSRTGGGGAIYVNYQLTLSSSTFRGNSHTSSGIGYFAAGGAVSAFSGRGGFLTVDSTAFVGNSVNASTGQANGGALAVAISSPSQSSLITSSSFISNSALSGQVASGGAVSSLQGSIVVSASAFTSNSAASTTSRCFGGALDTHLSNDPLTVTASSFTSNLALATSNVGSGGGAIYYGGGGAGNMVFRLSGSTFTSNAAVSDYATGGAVTVGYVGAGSSALFSSLALDNNTVVGQSTAGGAISLPGGGVGAFCGRSSFGKKLRNGKLGYPGDTLAVDDLDARGDNGVRFCLEPPMYKDVNSNYAVRVDCAWCDCGNFNPCDPRATCRTLQNPRQPECSCPVGTRGNGYTCGPVMVCY